jgi:hypothetical protein
MISLKMKNDMLNLSLPSEALGPVFRRREPKPYWERDWLAREYTERKRSAAEIAAQFGTCENNILFFLAKHGIPRRTISETRLVKKWAVRGSANGMFGRCGDKNPRWIDGSSAARYRTGTTSFLKDLIRAVHDRDGWRCVRCGKSHCLHGRLHTHHIKPWAGNPDCRLLMINIISVCQQCHNWIHSKQNVNCEYLSP